MRMTAVLYRVARRLAGEHRAVAVGHPHHLTAAGMRSLPTSRVAVYVAVDAADRVAYVGSVARGRPGAVAARLHEHLRAPAKARTWRRVWVIPLSDETRASIARVIEGRVALRLGLCATRAPSLLTVDGLRAPGRRVTLTLQD